jgi:hypothetical protein
MTMSFKQTLASLVFVAASAAVLAQTDAQATLRVSWEGGLPGSHACQSVVSLNDGANQAEGLLLYSDGPESGPVTFWISRLSVIDLKRLSSPPEELDPTDGQRIVDAVALDSKSVVYLSTGGVTSQVAKKSPGKEVAIAEGWEPYAGARGLFRASLQRILVFGARSAGARIDEFDGELHHLKTVSFEKYPRSTVSRIARLDNASLVVTLLTVGQGNVLSTHLLKLTNDLQIVGEQSLGDVAADVAATQGIVATAFYELGPGQTASANVSTFDASLQPIRKLQMINRPVLGVAQPTIAVADGQIWFGGSQSLRPRLYVIDAHHYSRTALVSGESNLLGHGDKYRIKAYGRSALFVADNNRMVGTSPARIPHCHGIWIQQWQR